MVVGVVLLALHPLFWATVVLLVMIRKRHKRESRPSLGRSSFGPSCIPD